MSEVDRQRITAVRSVEALGYWSVTAVGIRRYMLDKVPEADALLSLLIERADALMGCTDGSDDQDELEAIGRP